MFFIIKWNEAGYAFNPCTSSAEAEGSMMFKASMIYQSEFQDSQGYKEKPCFKKLKVIIIVT